MGIEDPLCLGLKYLELGVQTIGAQISFIKLLAVNLWGNVSVSLCITVGPKDSFRPHKLLLYAPDQGHRRVHSQATGSR